MLSSLLLQKTTPFSIFLSSQRLAGGSSVWSKLSPNRQSPISNRVFSSLPTSPAASTQPFHPFNRHRHYDCCLNLQYGNPLFRGLARLELSKSFSTSPIVAYSTSTSSTTAINSSTSSSSSNQSPPPPPPPSEKESFRTITRKYGVVSILIYTAISSTVYCLIFGSIMVFDVKPADIQALLNSVKSMIPFLTPPTASEVQQEQEDMEKEAASSQEKGTVMGWIRGRLENSDPKVLQFFTNAVLALAVTKLFSPFKLGITILITPTVARRLKALGFKFGPTTATRKGI